VAFVVAMLAIKAFISYLTKNGFKAFGYYRIAVGLIILGLWAIDYFKDLNLSNF
jgi:undecaprenyl-diphosphatase